MKFLGFSLLFYYFICDFPSKMTWEMKIEKHWQNEAYVKHVEHVHKTSNWMIWIITAFPILKGPFDRI